MSQQFVKNTDKPSGDSVLWEFADDWKVSTGTGVPYASLPGVERVNSELHEGLRTRIIKRDLDVIAYKSYFFSLTFFDNKNNNDGKYKPKDPTVPSNWHVFVFENESDAKKKLDYQKKFIKWDAVKTVPKADNTTTATSSPQQKITEAPKATNTEESNQIMHNLKPQYITTFTDPIEVEAHDEETIKDLVSKGFSYLPSILVNQNVWKETKFDDDGNNIGTSISFLMGRIINVRISDK